MTLSRRTLLAASIGAPVLGLASRSARAAEFEMKWGSSTPADHPLNVSAAEAVKKINSESKGRIDIKFFPGGQLGGDSNMMAQLRSGALDLYTNAPSLLSNLSSTIGVTALGFAFKDASAIWGAVDGEVGRIARKAAAAVNIHAFEKYWDSGFRTVSSGTKPIKTLADMQGFKIRVPVLPMYFSMFKALGAAPVSMNFSELYTSLQTKLVEGQENPLGTMYTAKFYEVQKFISLTNHSWEGVLITANRASFMALPSDVQEVITRNINAAGLKQREDLRKLNVDVQAKLEAAGVKFNSIDIEPFREKLKQAGYYKEWRAKIGDEAWQALEKTTGPLG